MSYLKQEYFLSQSVSGSFLQDDVANISFDCKRQGTPWDGLVYEQYCDVWGFTDSASYSSSGWDGVSAGQKQQLMSTQFSLPVTKGSGGYGEKSFVTKLDKNYEVLAVLISGSVKQDISLQSH